MCIYCTFLSYLELTKTHLRGTLHWNYSGIIWDWFPSGFGVPRLGLLLVLRGIFWFFFPQINVLQAKKKFEILDAVRAAGEEPWLLLREKIQFWGFSGAAFPSLCPQQSARKEKRDELLGGSKKERNKKEKLKKVKINYLGGGKGLGFFTLPQEMLICAHSEVEGRRIGINCFGKK